MIEILGWAGFEFVIVDAQHGFFGLDLAENLFRACDAVGATPLLRVAENDPVLIGKALDAGARGIVVPDVRSAAEAAAAVAASRYGPRGSRGACPAIRAGRHFIPDWKAFARRTEAETGVLLLVEAREGSDRFDEMVAVEGIRAIVIGPFDLSVSLGYEGDYLAPEVQERLEHMVRRSAEAKVPVVAPVFAPRFEDARAHLERWRAMGVSNFTLGMDKILLADYATRYVAAMRSGADRLA